MKAIHPYAAAFALVAIVGCSSGSDEQSPASIDEVVGRATAAGPDDSAKGENACLLEYRSKYDELLPLSRAAAATGLPADQAKAEYSRATKNEKYHEVSYSWPSDRVRTVSMGPTSISAPRPNRVAVSGIAPTSLKMFRMSYRPVTDEDMKKFEEEIDKSDEKGLETEARKDMAKGLAGMIGEITKAYRNVDGLADAASFNTAESKLYVLDRGVEFGVLADLSDKPDANQQVAVAIAEQILAACP